MTAVLEALTAAHAGLCERLGPNADVETEDVGCAVFDASGRLLAASGALHAFTLRRIGRRLAATLTPGDLLVLNDPFLDGSHVQDFTVVVPAVLGGEVLALVACRAHLGDIGGTVAGGYNDEAFEVWQEGVRVTPVQLRRDGRTVADAWEALLLNTRTPEALDAGLQALTAAAESLAEAWIENHGDARPAADQHDDEDEDEVRAALAALGERGPRHADVTGPGGDTVARVTVRLGDRDGAPLFDLTGSSEQVAAPVNAPLAATEGILLRAVLDRLGWSRPLTDGVLRAVRVTAPPGSVVSASLPAATSWCFQATGAALGAAVDSLLSASAAEVTRR